MCVLHAVISPVFAKQFFFTLCLAPMMLVLMIHCLCSQEACLLPKTCEHTYAIQLENARTGLSAQPFPAQLACLLCACAGRLQGLGHE